MNQTNKVALVTGGTKGIGLSVAQMMLQQGIKVVITGRSKESIDKVVNDLEQQYPGNIIGEVADVRDFEALKQLNQQIIAKWKRLDIIIANAGIGHFHSISELTNEQWNETIDVNLTGVFNSIKANLDSIIINKGYIITIASLAGTNFFAKGTAYNASKFGLVGFTQALMLDLRDHDVKCTTIMPGSVATYFNNNIPDDNDAWKIQPEDIGQIVIDLLNMHPRTLPSKVEVRPSKPPKK